MANKTIHELTPASTVDSNYEIAVYDIDGNGTKKATADQILKTSSLLYAYDDDEPTGEVDFTSQDTTLTPSSSTSVDLLSGNDSWSQRFVKISQMFKNIRFLFSKLGTTDISSLGDGTVTGALSTLNTNLGSIENSLILSQGTGRPLSLLNCTGTITGSIYCAMSADKKNLTLYGRVRITNFVRTGNNPGVNMTLPTAALLARNGHIIGFRGQSPVETITLNIAANSNIATVITTESYSNATNGTLTLVIPTTTVYIG